MKKRNILNRQRSLNSTTRRRTLLKKLHKKMSMRRQDYQTQVELEEMARAS